MYRSNRAKIYRPILHSSCPPDLCPHPQLSELQCPPLDILNFNNLDFCFKEWNWIENVYPATWASIPHGGGCLMRSGIKSQFDVTCPLPPTLSATRALVPWAISQPTLPHCTAYHTNSTTLESGAVHTLVSHRSLIIKLFIHFCSKSSGFIVALHNLQVQISLKYSALCISPNMSLLATKVVSKTRDSFCSPTLKASHADPWVEFSHKSGLFFFNWPPGPKTPTITHPVEKEAFLVVGDISLGVHLACLASQTSFSPLHCLPSLLPRCPLWF